MTRQLSLQTVLIPFSRRYLTSLVEASVSWVSNRTSTAMAATEMGIVGRLTKSLPF